MKYRSITHACCAGCGKTKDLYLRAYTCRVQGLYCAACCDKLDRAESKESVS